MRTLLRGITVVIGLVALGSSAWAQQQWPDPRVQVEKLAKVAEHTYAIPDEGVGLVPNVGIVVGKTGVLVIDTGLGARNGAAIAAAAQKLGGQRTLYLIATHFHPEHDLGAGGFPASTKMIRSKDQEQVGSSRVDLQACKLEYSIVSPK